MQYVKLVVIAIGALCLLFAGVTLVASHHVARVIAPVNPKRVMHVEIREIEPDPTAKNRRLVTVSVPLVGAVGTITLTQQDAGNIAPGQVVFVHATGRDDVPHVTDTYYQENVPVQTVAGLPFTIGGLVVSGFLGVVTVGLFFLGTRKGKERLHAWPAPAEPASVVQQRAEPVPAPSLPAPIALDDRRYHLRVAGLALLGQSMVIGTLVAYFGMLAGLIVLLIRVPASAVLLKFLVLPVGAAGWSVLQALWIRLQPPEGIEVKRSDAPALFALLDRLRQAAKAPAVHRVVIDGGFNAGISQIPRLGLFGWHRNHVALSLPLLQSLTPIQAETVLAHELAHLQRGHARFSNWIYRVRMTWLRIDHYLQTHRNWTLAPFRSMFGWYMPRFHAYSFAHARAQEYEADRFAARLTSAPAAAGALVAVAVGARRFDETFWPGVFSEARRQPQPSAGPYQSLTAFFAEPPPADQAKGYIDDRLAMRPSLEDTPPTLADRLAALGQPAALPAREGPSAAEVLLGPHLAVVAAALDRDWQANVAGWWKERHQEASTAETRLAEFLSAEAERALSIDELAELAFLTEAWRDNAAAIPRFRAWLAADPESNSARYGLGRVLLETDMPAAIELLEQAMQADIVITPHACRLIASRLAATGASEAAIQEQLDRAAEVSHEIDRAEQERDFFYRDTLIPHGLDAPALAAIGESLRAFPAVNQVWLSRKQVHHLPDRAPVFIGLVEIPWITRKRREVLQQVADALPVPGKAIVFLREMQAPSAVRKLPRFEGALVYRKP